MEERQDGHEKKKRATFSAGEQAYLCKPKKDSIGFVFLNGCHFFFFFPHLLALLLSSPKANFLLIFLLLSSSARFVMGGGGEGNLFTSNRDPPTLLTVFGVTNFFHSLLLVY